MSPSSKKIRVRVREMFSRPQKNVKIKIKEKFTYTCKNCENKYYTYHYFCPQCLGAVASSQATSMALKILKIPEEKKEYLGELLSKLCGHNTFDFRKAFQSLPWIMISDSDTSILEEWKEVLEAERVEAIIEVSASGIRKKKIRGFAPIFLSGANHPYFMSLSVDSECRTIAASVLTMSVRLKWVEVVLTAHRMLEQFYKGDHSSRIVFHDLPLQIEQQLQNCTKQYQRTYKSKEEAFPLAIDELKGSLDSLQVEMDEVQRQVEDQL